MFFKIKHYIQYLLLILFLVLSFQTYAIAKNKPDLSNTDQTIFVKDYKNYREYTYKGSQILISKNKKNINLHFAKDNTFLMLNQNKTKRLYELSKADKNLNHSVFYKAVASSDMNAPGQVGYYLKRKMKYYKSSSENDACVTGYKPLLERIGTREIVKKIGKFQIVNLIDKATCEKVTKKEKQDLETTLIEEFNEKSSSLTSCFTKPEVQKILDRDQFLQNNATAVFARFLNLVDKISNGTEPLKIKCKLEPKDAPAMASYNEKANPAELSINVAKSNLKQALNHELFHHGAQQYPLGENQACLDEASVQLFEEICKDQDITTKKLPTSADILNLCQSTTDKKPVLFADLQTKESSRENHNSNRGFGLSTTLDAATIQADQTQQNQIATNLQNTIKSEDFTPVAPTDVSTLANATLQNRDGVDTAKNYGERQTIVATPEVRESLDRVTTALDRAAAGMTTGLNTAMALAVNPAQATTIKAQASNSKIAAYPIKEILANKFSPVFDKPAEQMQIGGVSTLASATTSTPVKEALSLVSTKEVRDIATNPQAKPTRQPATDNKSDSNQPTRGIASVGSAPAIIPQPTEALAKTKLTEPLNIDNAPTQPTARTATTTINQPSQGSQSFDNSALQNLTAFNQMSGSQYKLVAKQYNDPTF
ncbi:MAG: hypothetical protein AABY53_02235, partial [Bdellovibrionota bacterium]